MCRRRSTRELCDRLKMPTDQLCGGNLRHDSLKNCVIANVEPSIIDDLALWTYVSAMTWIRAHIYAQLDNTRYDQAIEGTGLLR